MIAEKAEVLVDIHFKGVGSGFVIYLCKKLVNIINVHQHEVSFYLLLVLDFIMASAQNQYLCNDLFLLSLSLKYFIC